MRKSIFTVMLALLWCSLVAGSTPDIKKVYNAVHVNPHAPVIDGKLNDPVWEKAPWEGAFIQRSPYDGKPETQQTAFKIVYDSDNLYVAIRLSDTESGKIVRRMSRRDGLEGDWVTIQLDSYHDLQTAFVFAVNAEGVKYDKTITEDGNNENTSWDPVWYVKSSIDDKGWTAEMKIPFSQIRFSNNESQVWGMNVSRFLFRNEERTFWQAIPQNASGYVSRFGELHGINGIKHKRPMEITPYTVGRLQRFLKEEGNPFVTGRSQNISLGLDGKIGVGSDLTLDFTINPDFGQVEADPSQVNLTAFESYFQEKRPFFIEGKNILNFPVSDDSDNLFYSRRIGRSPHYWPSVGENEYLRFPENTSILEAFKLTGKTKHGVSIGVIDSLTGRERAEIDSGGLRRFETVEPFTHYFLARIRKDYNNGAGSFGGIFTATNRFFQNLDPNIDLLHKAAYSGGFDFVHSWNNKNYSISSTAVFSHVRGSKDAILNTQMAPVHYFQREGAAHVSLNPNRTSLTGFGGSFIFNKSGGSHFTYSAGINMRSPGLELNDLGYLRSADRLNQWVWAGYSIWDPFFIFRSFNMSINQYGTWNFDGENLSNGGNINLNAQFKNYGGVSFGMSPQGKHFSSNALWGGPSLKFPGAWSYWTNVYSDTRKPLTVEAGTWNYLGNDHSIRQHEIWGYISYRPVSNLSLSISPSYVTNKNVTQYVSEADSPGGKRYILGYLDQKTFYVTIRLNCILTPDLSIQFYGQPYISAGKYSEFKQVVNPRADCFENRYHIFSAGQVRFDSNENAYFIDENMDSQPDYSFSNPNFNFFQFRSNLVLRWEYIPGSTVFLVWSQGRTGTGIDGDFSLRDDFRDLFQVKPHNVFLIKFTYLFNL